MVINRDSDYFCHTTFRLLICQKDHDLIPGTTFPGQNFTNGGFSHKRKKTSSGGNDEKFQSHYCFVSVGQTLNLTFTLREHEGVGVTLNFLREEGYDQANNLLWDIEFTDQQAQGIFQNIFGTHYVTGHGILSGMTPSLLTSAFPGRGVCIFGGIDDNGHSVEASAEVTIQP